MLFARNGALSGGKVRHFGQIAIHRSVEEDPDDWSWWGMPGAASVEA
jgi:hypothetical protein